MTLQNALAEPLLTFRLYDSFLALAVISDRSRRTAALCARPFRALTRAPAALEPLPALRTRPHPARSPRGGRCATSSALSAPDTTISAYHPHAWSPRPSLPQPASCKVCQSRFKAPSACFSRSSRGCYSEGLRSQSARTRSLAHSSSRHIRRLLSQRAPAARVPALCPGARDTSHGPGDARAAGSRPRR